MEQEPIARTALDEMVESDQDQMLKAMIPYLPSSGQRFLSVYTKVRELRNTMSLFQSSRRTADLQATGFSGTDPLEMLWRRKSPSDRSYHQSYGYDPDASDHE